ncbi:MGC78821 protein, putative [Trichomonas vaginalis G3]|uniref:MGC78821 protein, putative n=1 Tax=Trichomonas vaginalis (strain ATCC PRA-98 / G3) TaxID=412133 RepID=A2EYV0_TRIV3|nr:H2A histone acetyltransferase protein [Trichomonas vaginalis G3]EAY02169.1 MGC78821 protein, putative [Trichomonas vaginalis G3]KAI5554265.1 H2A histone acetyltransferase protein [Trichomonas vaginalis G3]|eukprot:XP_001330572.1 MGC78821 protein [Trichomonas vaginalis G3]
MSNVSLHPQLTKKEQRRQADKAKTEAFNKMRRSDVDAEAKQDLLELIPMMRTFKRNGLDVAATYCTKLDQDLLKWALDLTERNLHQIYEDSWGWNETKKLNELRDKSVRFIVLRQGEELCGFVHIRFEFE